MTPADKQAALAALDDAREIIERQPIDDEGPPPVDPPPTGAWPASGTWAEREAWIDARAGTKVPLVDITPGNVPAGCRLVGGILYVDTASLLEGIRFDGTIRPTSASAAPVTLRNVEAQDVFANDQQSYRVALVEDCEFTFLPSKVLTGGWGTGVLNALRGGAVVRRTVLQAGADGAQCSGGVTFEESVIRDLTVGASTHNDFVQNYGGLVTFTRCHVSQTNPPTNHLNGVFADGGTYVIEDSSIVVTAPAGTNAFALHAGKHTTSRQIVVSRSKIRGRVIGKLPDSIVFLADVDHVVGY